MIQDALLKISSFIVPRVQGHWMFTITLFTQIFYFSYTVRVTSPISALVRKWNEVAYAKQLSWQRF